MLPLILIIIKTTVTDDNKTSNDNNNNLNRNLNLRSPGSMVAQAVRFHACALVPQRRFVTERTGNLTERGKRSPIYNPGPSCSEG